MAKNTGLYVYYLFYLFFCLQNIAAVKIIDLHVPGETWGTVTLNCRYLLENNEELYIVKWYKDDTEFYRCWANGTNQAYKHPDDIKIYFAPSSQFGSCYFDLAAITEKSGGLYKCEVSLDGPSFGVADSTNRLTVVKPESPSERRSSDIETKTEQDEVEQKRIEDEEDEKSAPESGSPHYGGVPELALILNIAVMICWFNS